MSRTVKLVITVPRELLEAVDQARRLRGETRSEFFQVSVQEFLRNERERESIQRYVRGYEEFPQSGEEVAAARISARAALARDPWE